MSTSKSSRDSRSCFTLCTTDFISSIKSDTVFSRRSDELQHSSYSTTRQSSIVSTDRNFSADRPAAATTPLRIVPNSGLLVVVVVLFAVVVPLLPLLLKLFE
uniref:Uncharacterized protein n=1 Tax=Anopheles coluzzii TaxID=1518534 RepID=A0A8W7P6V1_ANOCL